MSDIESEGSFEENSEEASDNEDVKSSNAGWVDSIAKILNTNKPKKKKTLVLSKAKKFDDWKPKPALAEFEIEGQDGTVKREQLEAESNSKSKVITKKKKQLVKVRVKPNILDKDRERMLTKIATRGVVQLFNAVRSQQKDISNRLEEAGPLEVKRDKALKSIDKQKFLDMLMGENETKDSNKTQKQVKETVKQEGTWNVLRDDFMMKAKLKDWDKELNAEMEVEEEQEFEYE